MSMQTATGYVAPWFSSLPLSDPRCNNDSCVAFQQEHEASQAAVSYDAQFLYGHYTCWIFAGIIILSSLHFISQIFSSRSSRVKEAPNMSDKVAALVRYWSYRRLRGRFAEYVNLPSLGVGVVILLVWAATTAMSFARHPYYRGRRGYGSPPLAIRTGLMSFALVPLTYATAGKVNFITMLTGLGHEKLNVFHRWTAYLMLYLAVIHTIPFIVQPLREGGAAFLRERWYRAGSLEYNGTPALGMLAGLAILSLPPLRRLAYEVFVQVHILLAIVYLGLLFWHAGDLGDSWAYLWATLVIWLLQIIIRCFTKTSTFYFSGYWFTQAPVVVTKMKENMIKLELEVMGRWRWEPGQHVFLRFAKLRPLDNHPFTIANIPDQDEKTAAYSSKMVFYVRSQQGLTARLASLSESGKMPSVTVDGPYGTIIRPRVETRYEHAILVAGGGGFSGVLPWLQHLANHVSDDKAVIKSVTMVWVVRQLASLSWASAELETAKIRSPEGSVKFELWVTGEAQISSTPTPNDKEIDTEAQSLESVDVGDGLLSKVRFGQRPNISHTLDQLVGAGRTIVFGCGPESLKIDLSNGVAALQRKVLRGEAKEIRLHTESFGW
ncbi:Ferric/cupric reductase transmembrane component 7 [Paramarasmius palmivorus]|uniref:ferric-chelate reductase (NADPH) n=1 Tax=Paramarasmius palmivorus TaxID=297713 RepID=A0AAW0C8L4_9AGAR